MAPAAAAAAALVRYPLIGSIVRRFTEWWRIVVSCALAFVIYTLFAWLPNFLAFILTATVLCTFGQYDVTVKKRKLKSV